MAKVSTSWTLNEAGLRALASRQRFRAHLRRTADAIERETQSKANWSGYAKEKHWHVREGTNAKGYATAAAYTTYSFAHLDEFGGAMYVGPSRPMRRALDSLGLKRKAL